MSAASSTRRFHARGWLGAVRVRAAVVSVFIVGVAFVLSASGVIWLLRNSLYQSATNTAKAEAVAISFLITTRGFVPAPLPISSEEMAAQVIGANGNVMRSSRDIAGQSAMADLSPAPDKFATATGVVLRVRRFTHVHLDIDDRFVVAAIGLRAPGPPVPSWSPIRSAPPTMRSTSWNCRSASPSRSWPSWWGRWSGP